jgi:hypothetical protein
VKGTAQTDIVRAIETLILMHSIKEVVAKFGEGDMTGSHLGEGRFIVCPVYQVYLGEVPVFSFVDVVSDGTTMQL